MTSLDRHLKKKNLESKVKTFLDESYLDVQGLSPSSLSSSIDEQYLARVLTKLAVGSATVWWSLLEIKDFLVLRRKAKDFKNGLS